MAGKHTTTEVVQYEYAEAGLYNKAATKNTAMMRDILRLPNTTPASLPTAALSN